MQNANAHPYEERIVFYASRIIAGQGKAGWNYDLAPVFAIAVTDFNFSHMSPKLVRDVMLVDRETMEPLTDKVHIILCSLKQLPGRWEDCRTELEEILFLIKNMENMDSTSIAYREGRYPEVFEAARSSRLRPEEVLEYRNSLNKLRDYQRGLEYESEIARRKGLEEGRAEGRAEGEMDERKRSIRFMLSVGISAGRIAAQYGITEEEVRIMAENE